MKISFSCTFEVNMNDVMKYETMNTILLIRSRSKSTLTPSALISSNSSPNLNVKLELARVDVNDKVYLPSESLVRLCSGLSARAALRDRKPLPERTKYT